jgi:hypothetical protein
VYVSICNPSGTCMGVRDALTYLDRWCVMIDRSCLEFPIAVRARAQTFEFSNSVCAHSSEQQQSSIARLSPAYWQHSSRACCRT